MELQNHINSLTDITSYFKQNNFKVNTYKNLKIVSYPYDSPPEYNDENDLWKLYVKGAVIDQNNKLICLSPIKSFTLILNKYLIELGIKK